MCGIAGYSGHFDQNSLHEAIRRIAHRGPDDCGIFARQQYGIGLGHVRLAILDLSSLARQPMLSEDGSVSIVFNGEIYNFKELRKQLEVHGYAFTSRSDTEVLLKLYIHEGLQFLEKLNGIFAFAIWDERTRTLLLARDALGVKPLYYSQCRRGFAFSSEIKGLLALTPELRELDYLAIHRYLTFLWSPGCATPLQGVRKMAPGEAMIVQDGKIIHRWPWYRLPVHRDPERALDTGRVCRDTVHFLRRAVRRQLVSDVPVGAFLSGGLDSSSIVALAKEETPNIQCFTIDIADGQEAGVTDDLPYARRVAQHLQVPLKTIRVDAGRMADDFPNLVVQLDEPLIDPAPLNVLYISRLARDHGIKVLLSGAGGDDLFTGYRRHLALQFEGYWKWLPAQARSFMSRVASCFDHRRSFFRKLSKLLNSVELDGDDSIIEYFVWIKEHHLLQLYSPEFRCHLATDSRNLPLLEFMESLPPGLSRLEKMLALEQRFFLSDHNLVYTDKMSMAVGVEVRVPFLDLDLVEYAASIPISLKQRGRNGKWILKKAMEPFLPREIIYRPKTGFGAPLRRWIRKDLRPLLEETLAPSSLKERGLFDPRAVQRLIELNDAGRVDAAYTLYGLMAIEIWCRHYLDQLPNAAAKGI